MSTVATSVDEVPVMSALTAADRCDRCDAQAYVRVSVAGSTLDFCAHHFRENKPGLVKAGASVVIDDRPQLSQPV